MVRLLTEIARRYPGVEDAAELVRSGQVRVDGSIVLNEASLVRPGASIVIRAPSALRGEAKLRAALDAFDVPVAGRVALDAGAAAGGFTRVLLERGARRVYAVDAGHGQLLGSLRQDPRVVNLERTNLADAHLLIGAAVIELVTLDLSYVSLAVAVPQLNRVAIAGTATLVALVKPMFELRLPQPPTAPEDLHAALRHAVAGIESAGWEVLRSIESPVRGSRDAIEHLVLARRSSAWAVAAGQSVPGG
jgi:23S rRNA (cytidine1920-2'-O)/16S rRNA (cytidine1409-2'-O)-methyltransferase